MKTERELYLEDQRYGDACRTTSLALARLLMQPRARRAKWRVEVELLLDKLEKERDHVVAVWE